jgi:hypothetical protein
MQVGVLGLVSIPARTNFNRNVQPLAGNLGDIAAGDPAGMTEADKC